MTVRTFLALLLATASGGCAQPGSREGDAGARRIEARVTAVTDGDTLRVRTTGSGRDYDVRRIGSLSRLSGQRCRCWVSAWLRELGTTDGRRGWVWARPGGP
jgi:endonuclease YncB( thermonuclease family)